MGIPTTNRAMRYAMMNLTPPCLNVRNGNFQMLPRPMEAPTVERTKAGRLCHLARVLFGTSSGPEAAAWSEAAGAAAA